MRSQLSRVQRLHSKRCRAASQLQYGKPFQAAATKCAVKTIPAIAEQLRLGVHSLKDLGVHSLKEAENAPGKYGGNRDAVRQLRLVRNSALHPKRSSLLPPPRPPALLDQEDDEFLSLGVLT